MKRKANLNVKKFIEAIYLLSLAEILNRRLVKQRLDHFRIKEHIKMCDSDSAD